MTTKIETFVGIDFSLTSPAICVGTGPTIEAKSCQFYFLTSKRKFAVETPLLKGTFIDEYNCQEQRHDFISNWALNIVLSANPVNVFIEDYAYTSTGRVFNLGENCGLLKHKLWKQQIIFHMLTPTTVKKTATGKGNANKEVLQEHFIALTGINIKNMLGMTDKQWNPSSDIIDSFYICQCGMNNFYNGQYHGSSKQTSTT